MEFKPSIISIVSLQKFFLGLVGLLAPLIIFSLTQNLLFTGIGIVVGLLIIYFWSISYFLQRIKVNGSIFTFYDPGSHYTHHLQNMKRISTNYYIFDLSSIKSLYISIETSGNIKIISFFDSYSKLRSSRKLFNFDLTRNELFTISGIWTETDLEKIYQYIKKSNLHLKDVKLEYFV
jgi:hypothetical protein